MFEFAIGLMAGLFIMVIVGKYSFNRGYDIGYREAQQNEMLH